MRWLVASHGPNELAAYTEPGAPSNWGRAALRRLRLLHTPWDPTGLDQKVKSRNRQN